MKPFAILTLLICSVFHLSAQTLPGELLLADPFVLEDNGTYYIYGTSARDGIVVYCSKDLKKWEGPCGATNGLALHKDNSWGEHGFWAPEVYKVGDKYVMTYSVEEHIAYAESDSPKGPFVNSAKTSYLEEKGIDSHIFIDDDGQAYMFWVRFDGGNVIFSAKMSKDLHSIDMNTVQRIIDVQDGTWEKTPAKPVANVAEGPFVIKHKGLYYLTYSCNHYQSPDYAVGYATATSPMGPWTRYEGNPIIHNHGDYRGTGHHALLKTEKGDIYMIYHAHYSHERVGPRRTLISPVRFKRNRGKADVMEVSKEIIVPELIK